MGTGAVPLRLFVCVCDFCWDNRFARGQPPPHSSVTATGVESRVCVGVAHVAPATPAMSLCCLCVCACLFANPTLHVM